MFVSWQRDRGGRRELDIEVLALAERGGAAIARHHRGRTGAGADRAARRGPLAAAEDGAENRAADRRAADLLAARAGRRVAVAQHLLGMERHFGAVGEDERVEPDAQARLLLDLAA